jgi:hypothetical protein
MNTDLICGTQEVQQIFQQASQMEFFNRLNGYNDVVSISFVQQIHGNVATVRGFIVKVEEETIT